MIMLQTKATFQLKFHFTSSAYSLKKQPCKKACGTGSFDGSLLPGTLLINNPSRESFVFVRASAFALARWCQLALFADRPDLKDIVAEGDLSRTRHTFTPRECVCCHTMRMTKHVWPLSSALCPKLIRFCAHPHDRLLDEKCRNRLMLYEIRLSQFVHVKLSAVQKSGMLPVCVRRFLLKHVPVWLRRW